MICICFGGICMVFIWWFVVYVDILIWFDIWFEIVFLFYINSGVDIIVVLLKYENIKKLNFCIDIFFWGNFSINVVNFWKMLFILIMSRIK